MIIGIDLGNFAIKTSEGLNIESKTSKPSILTSSPVVEYANKGQFILGEGDYCTEYRKVRKENYLDLLFAAIALSTDDIENKIVLGLPVSQFKNDKAELINLIMQNREMTGFINNIRREILIEDIEVYPEGIGAVGNKYEGIIVDIGGRTTDICQVYRVNGKRKIDNAFSEALGMLNLYSDFIKRLNTNHSLDLKFNDAERILKRGLKIRGQEVDITDEKCVFKEYVEKIITKLKLEYSADTLDVALLGGGALLLGRPFSKRLPQSFVIENSLFANAQTFKKVGEKLWLK